MNSVSLKLLGAALFAATMSAPGCSLFEIQMPHAEPTSTDPTATVVFLQDGQKKESVAVPLKGQMYVGQLLEQTKASKRFKDMNIQLWRQTKEGRPLRMGVKYNSRTKRVEADTDYAVFPGDRVVVTDESKSILDRMIGGLGGSAINLPMPK